MNETNLRSLDLNLLVTLRALLEEKHISRAAARVGMSQPAMSRSLGRLRVILQDQILVKGAKGLELTTRAIALYSPLLSIFAEVNKILTPLVTDHASMRGEITIATRDNEMISMLPPVIQHIAKNAPHLKMRIVSLTVNDLSPLDNNTADFIMTCVDSDSSSLCRYNLYNEEFVCLVAKDNPCIKDFSLEKYLTMKHCSVTVTGNGPGLIDRLLAKRGLERNATIRVQHFLVASHIVAGSDLIVTLPRKVGKLLVERSNDLVILESPLDMPSFPIYLYWHARSKDNPVHKWLRQVIREKCT